MTINKPALSAALKMVAPVISSNPIIPALAGVKITEKYLTGGNSFVSVAIPVQLGLPETILNYAILRDAIYGLDGDIDLEMKGVVAVLKSPQGKIQVPVIGQVSEYPEVKGEFTHNDFTLTQEDMQNIAPLADFTHMNYGQPYWQGVLYNGEIFCAFDSTVLAVYEKKTDFGKDAIFPKELFKLLLNIGAETYEFTRGMVVCKTDGKPVAYAKYVLIDEAFPPVKQVISGAQFDKVATIDRYNINKGFDLNSISTTETHKEIELNIDPSGGITAITGEEALNTLSEININSINEGFDDMFRINFDLVKLTKGLKYLGGSSVNLDLLAPTKTMRAKSDIEGRSIIINPMA